MKLLQDVRPAWRHFVVCALLNRTTGDAVARVLPKLWREFPVPGSYSGEAIFPERLTSLLHPLGMQNVRAKRLTDIAHFFYTKPNWRGPEDEWPPHTGPYAMQSYRILFLRERPKDIVDAKLREYVASLPRGALTSRRKRA